jgi:hypothetical protein
MNSLGSDELPVKLSPTEIVEKQIKTSRAKNLRMDPHYSWIGMIILTPNSRIRSWE